MIILGQTKVYFANNPIDSLKEDIKRKVMISPLFLALNISFLGTVYILGK